MHTITTKMSSRANLLIAESRIFTKRAAAGTRRSMKRASRKAERRTLEREIATYEGVPPDERRTEAKATVIENVMPGAAAYSGAAIRMRGVTIEYVPMRWRRLTQTAVIVPSSDVYRR